MNLTQDNMKNSVDSGCRTPLDFCTYTCGIESWHYKAGGWLRRSSLDLLTSVTLQFSFTSSWIFQTLSFTSIHFYSNLWGVTLVHSRLYEPFLTTTTSTYPSWKLPLLIPTCPSGQPRQDGKDSFSQLLHTQYFFDYWSENKNLLFNVSSLIRSTVAHSVSCISDRRGFYLINAILSLFYFCVTCTPLSLDKTIAIALTRDRLELWMFILHSNTYIYLDYG